MRRRTQSPDPSPDLTILRESTPPHSLEGSTGSREQRTTIFSGTLAWVGPEALLFSTDRTPDLLSEHATILGIQVRAEGLPQERAQQVQLLIHVGDRTRPRAQATLADLLRLGERPLNLRRRPGQLLTVSLSDPRGELAGLTVSLTVELRWRKG
jgi:hypothetical protein